MDGEWLPLALDGGGLDRGRRAADDDVQLELLDDILALLIDSPPPGGASASPPLGLKAPQEHSAASCAPVTTPVAAPAAGNAAKSSPGGGASAESSSELSAREEEDKSATPVAPVRTKKRRKRPKDELDYLRGRVGELEQELQALVTPSVKDVDDEDDKQWMEIAQHQRSQVQDAWATNHQLRTMLEGQLAVAQQLQQALQQHLKMARFEGLTSPSPAMPTPPQATEPAGSSALFKSLTEGLDALYARREEIFVATDISLQPNKARDRSTEVKTDARGAYFESVMGERMPFTVDAVERALFRSLSLNIASQPYGSTTSLDTNTFNITFSEPLRSGQLPSITYTGKTAMRRYTDGDQVVTIWNSVVEIDGSMYVRLREEGWGIVRPDASNSPEHPVTWLQHIVRTRPEVAGILSPEEQRAHVGEMTDLVLDTYRRLDLKMRQTIENLLIAESIMVPR